MTVCSSNPQGIHPPGENIDRCIMPSIRELSGSAQPCQSQFIIVITKFQTDLQEKLLTDDSLLDAVLLEVLRLYPPFLGGRRIIKKVDWLHVLYTIG